MVVPVQVEAARGLPARVEVDLHVLAEEELKPFGQLLDGRTQLVNGVEHERRALAQLFGEFDRFEARDVRLAATARDVSEVRRGRRGLAVLHEAQAREVEPVAAEYFVQTLPRHQAREPARAPAHVQEANAPGGVEELLRGARL